MFTTPGLVVSRVIIQVCKRPTGTCASHFEDDTRRERTFCHNTKCLLVSLSFVIHAICEFIRFILLCTGSHIGVCLN